MVCVWAGEVGGGGREMAMVVAAAGMSLFFRQSPSVGCLFLGPTSRGQVTRCEGLQQEDCSARSSLEQCADLGTVRLPGTLLRVNFVEAFGDSHDVGRGTILVKIISEMRGADLIVFRINENGNDCNSVRFKNFRIN